ncbi:MAG: hypothetical protein J2P17_28630 [Mycobacterium sp.]|nr:hypothetical protein [Mycobacterium sp.]
MTSDSARYRALTATETAVLHRILSSEFSDADRLRAQLGDAMVVKKNWTDNSPSVDIVVPESAERARLDNGPVPVAAHVVDDSGGFLGELLVWVTDGRIAALEYSWVTDDPPNGLPDPRMIRVS